MIPLYGINKVVPMFSAPVDIERRASGAYDENGRWQDHGIEHLEVCGSVQTMSDKDLVTLDEGRRLRGGIVIFTTHQLRTGSVDASVQPDIVLWNGARWEVTSIEDWFEIAGFYRVMAVRMGQ